MKVNVGGDRLGSGAKMNVELHNYYRSTHNLSKNFKSSLAPGLLYPCYVNLGLNGDKFEIDIKDIVRTIPTKAPLFGQFKMQIDFFVAPMRLYQGILHNNPINIGMSMQDVKLPICELSCTDNLPTSEDYSTSQIHPANLWAYLGLRGLGRSSQGLGTQIGRRINAVPLLAYYDIFKNYYANKQEDYFNIVTAQNFTPIRSSLHVIELTEVDTANNTSRTLYVAANSTITLDVTRAYSYKITGQDLRKPSGIANIIFTTTGLAVNNTTSVKNTEVVGDITFTSNSGLGSIEFKNDTYNLANTEISLKQFELSLIDDMREKLLTHTTKGVPFVVDTDTYGTDIYNLYTQSYTLFLDDKGNELNSLDFPLAGLVTKTYQSDLFNNWIKTEFIDGQNGIAEITRIDTSNGLQLDALNLAQKVYNMLNRIALAGGTYEDWQEAVYTQSTIRKAETPMYVGGKSAEIMFEEVLATTESGENQKIGSMGGRGKQVLEKGGHIEFKIEEPSIIMGIISLTPRLSYSQGNRFYLTDIFSIDDLHKPALDGIGYQDLLVERMAWWGTEIDPISNGQLGNIVDRKIAGKVPAWLEYMTDVDECYGDFALEGSKAYMVLNRNYGYERNSVDPNKINAPTDITTYIDPDKYNYAFALQELQAQNFWAEVQFNITARRLMSAKQIPNL